MLQLQSRRPQVYELPTATEEGEENRANIKLNDVHHDREKTFSFLLIFFLFILFF